LETLRKESVDISTAVEEILSRFEYLESEHGYILESHIERELYAIGDGVKIEQVLYNLIGNAVNYTGDDKVVRIRLKLESDAIRFEVSDSGRGIPEEELAEIEAEAEKVSIFRSGNMSIGINLLIELCREASKTLGESFDIEITEKHHNQKLDAPSGTAIMIANALSETREETEYVYDRQSVRKKREPKEIGIHSVRGGTIVGEHEVLFAGNNEMITLTHTATSREIFATGAIKAAIYLAKKANTTGLYNMSDLINNR
jgi:4-hydroxy-tetrahydrodipicolinate reductase